ncbi:pilin [Mammaliicoccus sp. D-M17]|uniref:pilin n=1 Tax=Mammaliicoccus sp. D-M17 TaxID=2898677 RepID=UPI001EFC09F9|nr:pilin [Mammaliicoccus sp. D-M17]
MNNILLSTSSVSIPGGAGPGFITQLTGIVEQIAGWALIIAPSIALVLLVIGGIKYMNANDKHKRDEVIDRFKNIFIGLVIVFSAVQIINFVLKMFS